jgi:hypothetical protein
VKAADSALVKKVKMDEGEETIELIANPDTSRCID